MIDHGSIIVSDQVTLEEAIRVLDQSGRGTIFIADAAKRLVGVLSDGDVRRAFLRHVPLTTPIHQVMNRSPKSVNPAQDGEKARELMDQLKIRYVPMVDADDKIIRILTHEEVHHPPARDNLAVIMCGGLGSRLKELTKERPKPLLSVGGRPILETILYQLASYQFRKVVLATNYMAEMINGHFGDGEQIGIEIEYLREEKPLGTAGALRLIKPLNHQPILVMNGDILTKVNFNSLLQYHKDGNYHMTACITGYEFKIPYGVVDMDENYRMTGLREKPSCHFFVNAGIYVLDPALLELIPPDEVFNMTDMADKAAKNGFRVGTFPIHEYWIDIGQLEDYQRANHEFPLHFLPSDGATPQ